jgi:hypothetical protein
VQVNLVHFTISLFFYSANVNYSVKITHDAKILDLTDYRTHSSIYRSSKIIHTDIHRRNHMIHVCNHFLPQKGY